MSAPPNTKSRTAATSPVAIVETRRFESAPEEDLLLMDVILGNGLDLRVKELVVWQLHLQ